MAAPIIEQGQPAQGAFNMAGTGAVMAANPALGAILGGAQLLGGLQSANAANEAQKAQQNMLGVSTEQAMKQAQRGDQMWNYFNSTYLPAESNFVAQSFGYDPAKIKPLDKTPEEQARVAELNKYIADRNGFIAGTTSRKNEGSRVQWRAEIAQAQEELNRLQAPKYADDAFKAQDTVSPTVRAGLASLNQMSGISPESQANLSRLDSYAQGPSADTTTAMNGLTSRIAGPTSAQDVLSRSSTPIQYYESNPNQYETEAGKAAAGVEQQSNIERQNAARRLLSMGINPNSSKMLALDRQYGLANTATKVGAMNQARDVARTGDYTRRVDDYNRGMAGVQLADTLNQGEFSRAGTTFDASRALTADQINNIRTAIAAREGVNTDSFNRTLSSVNAQSGLDNNEWNKRLAVLQLGRGMATNGLQATSNAAGLVGSVAGQYGNTANQEADSAADLISGGLTTIGRTKWGQQALGLQPYS